MSINPKYNDNDEWEAVDLRSNGNLRSLAQQPAEDDEWEDITPVMPEPEPELEASGSIRSLIHIDYFITQAVFFDHQGDIKSLCFRCDIDPGPSLVQYFLG